MSHVSVGVLVVDDERFFREAIEEILVAQGITCTCAEGGEQAIELAADTSIGVAVLDVRLPDTDGIEVLRRLRALRPSMRVIMLSASTDQELVLEALRLGACDYLAKPLHDEELVLAVRRALDGYCVTTDWVRLRGRLERLVTRVEELSERARELRGEQRESALQRGAVEALADVLEAGRTSLMLLDEPSGRLRVAAAVGHALAPEEIESVGLGAGVAGRVLESAVPLIVGDHSRSAEVLGELHPDRYRSASFALVPLRAGDERLGVLCATERAGGDPFDQQDAALLRLLAMQLSGLMVPIERIDASSSEERALELAVERGASLAGQATQVFTKPDIEDDFDSDAELVRQVCQAMVDEIEPDRIVNGALRALAGLLPAAPVAIFLLDPESGCFVREWECDSAVDGDRERLDPHSGLTAVAVQTGHLVASDEPAADSRFDPATDTPQAGEVGPFLCLPLRLRGKVVGLFRAFLCDAGRASPRTAEALASALSALLRNVMLYRSLVESIEEVAEARRTAGSHHS